MPTVEQNDKIDSALTTAIKNELQAADWPRESNVVEATLIKKLPREAYFDLGRFGTGLVFGVEAINAREILRNLEVGAKIPAKIVNVDGENGYIELSLSEAGKQKLWQQVGDLMEIGEVIKVKVLAANAGGLTTSVGDIDLKAFLPVSQLSLDHYPRVTDNDRQKIADELKKFIGEELGVKIIDMNPRSNKLIVSEREVLSANVKELLSKYSVGQVVDGLVSGIADFGVFVRFVDNPDIEGMVHISELAHRLVDNPKEIVKVNDQIKIKIVDIKEGKVFLSLKAMESNPWERISESYKAGQEISGTVYKFNPFGAVINLEGGHQGLIHISEFGGADEMKAALTPDTPHKFVIDSVKPEEKRIVLKLKK
ncbi:MAG: S1 RNA-binding domain-containing protein [Patescibacteria group bacterium]|nr:S1 RNA-binding domain-containing protein [Patescibacteria group bacterium]MDE2015192.1 S1 RNA-binding domain-containing protein [Patescibacteria group bacterium]MDE2226619.1 S1 RNA-binding domain-containing protein [Patescibacteria group bacterium]